MASPFYIEGLCGKSTLVSKPPSIMVSFAQEFGVGASQIHRLLGDQSQSGPDARARLIEAFLLIRLAIQDHGRFGRSHATALLREEAILNLSEFDRCGALFVVVSH